jgi:hypothetical protein
MTNTLAKYDAAKHALAEARSVDEVKDIRDKSIAMKLYAKQAKDKKLEADAHEIRMRAERRLGEMMAEQKKAVGLNKGGKSEHRNRVSKKPGKPTLASQNIDKNLADRSRKAAALSEEKFELKVEQAREHITTPVKLKVVSEKPKPESARYLAEFKTACDHWLPKLSADDLKKARTYFQERADAREKANGARPNGSGEQTVEEPRALNAKLAEEEQRESAPVQ